MTSTWHYGVVKVGGLYRVAEVYPDLDVDGESVFGWCDADLGGYESVDDLRRALKHMLDGTFRPVIGRPPEESGDSDRNEQ